MAKIFVVSDQANLTDLTHTLLKSKTSKKVREAAVEKIRAANPTVDLDNLQPGRILVIPDLEREKPLDQLPGASPAISLREAPAVLKDVVTRARAKIEAQAEALKTTRTLLTSAEMKALAKQDSALKETLAAWEENAAHDADTAAQQVETLAAAVDRWAEDLATLLKLAGEG